MNSVFVYCEIEEGTVADVSLELLTKGRALATKLGVKLEAIALGEGLKNIEKQVFPYGVDVLWVGDDARLAPYTTSDCTSLEIGEYTDAKSGKKYENLLYQIRPAFGGNIVATIVNPECRPQMATVREGVMKKEIFNLQHQGEVKKLNVDEYLDDTDLVVRVIERHMEKSKVNIKAAPIIVAGGYGVGSKENFNLLYELAAVLGGEVGASRAAVDAGFCEHERQIGQTGTTVRPKLYIACGISGQIQHTAGMEESSMVIAINTDANAPINKFADYVITGDLNVVIPKMIQYYKKNSK